MALSTNINILVDFYNIQRKEFHQKRRSQPELKVETVIEYDSTKVSYEKLLEVFWKNIDPFDAKGQFCDKGPQYRSGIFTSDENEIALAQQSKTVLQEKLGDKATIVTEILPAAQFYDAEEYHQNYYQKNPLRYRYYRYGCGRDKRLEEVDALVTGAE